VDHQHVIGKPSDGRRVHDQQLLREVGRDSKSGDRLGQVVEDAVEERHVEPLEAEPREVVEVAHLEGDVVARALSIRCQEACLLDPQRAHVEPEAIAGSKLLGPEEIPAAVARAIEHAASLQAIRVDSPQGLKEEVPGVLEGDLPERVGVGAGRRL
jgi:hypothetical protein